MKIKQLLLTILALCFLASGIFAAEPGISRTSLIMRLNPQRANPEWRFTPDISTVIFGPLSDSASVTVEYTLPTGKPFVKLTCRTEALTENDSMQLEDCGRDLNYEAGTSLTGVFGFQIKVSDELNGINKVIYAGKFTVNKYLYNPSKQPQFAKNFYFNIEQDWRLQVGMTWVNWDEHTPKSLVAEFWMKGESTKSTSTGYLVYNGKTVAEVSQSGGLMYGLEENTAQEFNCLTFKFWALTEVPNTTYDGYWKLYENPGEYEVKVIRDGELVRVMKFTIGKNGLPIDNGIAKKSNISDGGKSVFPTQILGKGDGTINRLSFKDGWWGNPIVGLTP
jgi:hypothetical protein